jgi:hypothetical protein
MLMREQGEAIWLDVQSGEVRTTVHVTEYARTAAKKQQAERLPPFANKNSLAIRLAHPRHCTRVGAGAKSRSRQAVLGRLLHRR